MSRQMITTESGNRLGPEATLKLVNEIMEPSADKLVGLSVIPKGSVLKIARSRMMQKALDDTRHVWAVDENGEYLLDEDGDKILVRWVPLDEIFIHEYLMAMRSVGGRMLQLAGTMALEQMYDDEEEFNTGYDM